VHPPFRQRFELAVGPQEASFHATSLKWERTLGPRFGRPMFGFHGMGTIEAVPAGVRVVARRYRYAVHLAVVGTVLVVTVVGMGLLAARKALPTDDAVDVAAKMGGFWGVVAVFIATPVMAWLARFSAPVTEVLDRSRIELVQMVGPRLRIYARGGDVELWFPKTEALQGFLHALAAMGIAMR
jgi:hypothetical protein